MTPTAMTTAAIITGISSTMPTAVRTESSEKTMSSRTICTSTPRQRRARGSRAGVRGPVSPSSDSWISVVAFQSRKRPPPMRIRSRHENSLTGDRERAAAVRPMIHEIVSSSRMRIPIARPRPMNRARSRWSAGSRWTRIEMKMTLSMPRTISRTVSVRRATQVSGSVNRAMMSIPIEDTGPPRASARTMARAVTDPRSATRSLPVLDVRGARRTPRRPRAPVAPADARLAEYLPEAPRAAALPRLDAGLPDEPERLGGDGRSAAGGRLRGGAVDGGRRPRRHQHVRHPRGCRAEGHRPAGPSGPAQGGQPGAAGRADRLLRPGAGARRAAAALSGGRPVPAARRGAGARRSARSRVGAGRDRRDRGARRSARSAPRPRSGRTVVGVADGLSATRARAVGEGTVARGSTISAWLPIIYGCDKTCTYCIVPFSRGPERSRPFDDIVDEARALAAAGYREVTLLGQNVNSYGHDLAPEARFAHVDAERWAGRRLDLHGRPDLAELIRAIDGLRTADGHPAIPRLRFVTSHPWDLSDRLIAALADCPSVCEHLHLPVQSGDDAVLRRMGRQYTIEHYRERLDRIREAVPGITVSTDVIVGFLRRDRGAVPAHAASSSRTVRYDQVFAAAYSPRPGTPATRLADDVPADDQAPPAQRAARRPGGHRPRAQPGVAGPRRRGARRHDHAATLARPRRRRGSGRRRVQPGRRRRVVGPDAWQQARPPHGRADPAGPRGHRPHRSRRSVRPAGRSRHAGTTYRPLTPARTRRYRDPFRRSSQHGPSGWMVVRTITGPSHGRGGKAPWTIPGLISCVDRRRRSSSTSSSRSRTGGSRDASSSSARRSSACRCRPSAR